MANSIQIFVEVDPTGQGSAKLRTITSQAQGLGSATGQAGASSRSMVGDFAAAQIIVDLFRRATDAAIEFGKESIKAYGELAQAERFLASQVRETGGSFEIAKSHAAEFDQTLTLSRANAERLYAVTLQFTHEINRVGQTDQFITRLSDTLSAHGVSPEQQGDITRSLLAGRATELAKVLGKNVTQIEKEAATAGGYANFSKLDDATKKLLLFNEVLKQGEKDAGASNQRLQDTDGILAGVSAQYERAKESAGKFLIEQTAIGTALKGFARAGIPGIFDFAGTWKAEEAAQNEALRREAQRRSDEKLKEYQQGDLRYQLAKDPSRKFESMDFFVASQQLSPETEANIRTQAKQAGDIKREEGQKIAREEADRAEREAIGKGIKAGETPDQITHDINVARTKALVEWNTRAKEMGDEEQSVMERRLRLVAFDTLAETQVKAFEDQYAKLFKDKKVDIITAEFAERQFNEIKAVFSPAKAKEIGEGLAEIFKKAETEAAHYLKGVRDKAEELFSTLAERYAGEGSNPFVKIFSEAEERAKRLEKQFGILGDRTVKELQAIEEAHTKQAVLAAQLDADLEAASLRNEAAHLRELGSIQELTRAEKARLDVITATADAGLKVASDEAKAQALRQGKVFDEKEGSKDKAALFNREYNELINQREGLAKLGGRLGIDARAKVDEQIITLFEGADKGFQKQEARGAGGYLAGIYEERATYEKLQVADAKAKADREAREEARDRGLGKTQTDLIRAAERSGLNSADLDKRILGLKDGQFFDPSGNVRAGASEREADRLGTLQEKAREATMRATAETEKLTASVDNLARAMQSPNQRELLIRILNQSRAEVHDDLYGSFQPLQETSTTR